MWRIVAKSFCLSVLPPIFRFLSHLVTLPHRRFYTPATDYTSVPPANGLRPIPSVIDLPRMVAVELDDVAASTARRNGAYGALTVKQRAGAGAGAGNGRGRAELDAGGSEKGAGAREWAGPGGKRERAVKHYDADGACARRVSFCVMLTLMCVRVDSVDEGVCVLRDWDHRKRRGAGDVRGAGLGRQDELKPEDRA